MFPGLRSYLCAVAALALSAVCASAQDLARATIVDSSENTKEYAKQLADLAVTVIGRYYGRCPQWSPDRSKRIVRNKRMIDDAGEVDAILSDRRLGLLSVYQFYSQDSKFDNSRESGAVTVLDDRPRKSDSKTVADFNDCITPDKPNTIEEDAKLDGYAAIMQAAESIKQPKGTAIYFGVDFNLTDERRANVLKYFCIINKIVTDAGYQVGVYGNGAISCTRTISSNTFG